MSYSLAEALWLHARGITDDLLVAYPTADRGALRALAADDAARQHLTVTIDRMVQAVTELAAGSGLVGPTLFDAYRRFHPRPALQYALPVVRRPGPGIATLFSGGYVASGTGTPDRLPRPLRPAGLRLTRIEGAGEVQTPVAGPAADGLGVGDRVWLRHAKGGELAERLATYYLYDPEDPGIEGVATYRGEGQCFG